MGNDEGRAGGDQELVEGGEVMTGNNHESRDLFDAYRFHLDVWKVQNDNYFRRIQVLMLAVQAALFAGTLKVIDLQWSVWIKMLVLAILALLGILSAKKWIALNEKQNQYIEFCRRTLRNMECRLIELGVPLCYFTLEAHVFGHLRNKIPDSTGVSIQEENSRHVVQFQWAGERYPDPDTRDTKKKCIHELAKVKGGILSDEKKIAESIIWVWSLVIVAILGTAMFNMDWQSLARTVATIL